MTPDIADRFYFPDGREMNPWYTLKTLTFEELYLCVKLVDHGILGRSSQSFKQGHLNPSLAEKLVQDGILQKLSIKEIAKCVVNNPELTAKKEALENDGGFLSANRREKKFISLFDIALNITKGKDTYLDPNEIRFIVVNQGLYDLIEWKEFP